MKDRKTIALVLGIVFIVIDIVIVIYLINLWFRLFDSSILSKILVVFTLISGFIFTWRQISWIQKKWGQIPWIAKQLKQE
ncbi:MAG: hypothetical protein A2Z42_00680 [Candidatus Woykebacteria bacterium RBG_19FT_COMBO_43_10]|uniref:Uncharacterized protein n=1 Tax=Candidatus Woykebacteria bacterium RBG_19FT_COMBO_43_10 TaxID=1802598 RepID=A0A1G1WI10_9BACT|nr:MAG: hypothetical protein A2Z42_00680 [Candidatus Woykebacteria bacterium RBG_19FT_COMBO_43_10]